MVGVGTAALVECTLFYIGAAGTRYGCDGAYDNKVDANIFENCCWYLLLFYLGNYS